MKAIPLVALLAATGAAHADVFVDHARVRSVQPQYESVQMPREQCRSEWVREPRPVAAPHNYGGAIIGGVAGAVIGRQIGGGSGRDAATAVGAAVGAMTGDRLANRDAQPYGHGYGYDEAREVRRCHTVMETQSQLTGYRVQYDYQGRVYTTFTREHPGHSLPVRVSVSPVEPEYHRR